MKKYSLFFAGMLGALSAFAQRPAIQWQKIIGGSRDECPNAFQQTSDGGYIIGGSSLSDVSGDKTADSHGGTDFWIVKLNGDGNIQWQKTIGGSDEDYVNTILQTTDGGYIVGGTSKSGISGDKTEANLGGDDYWLVKLDEKGNIQWQNTLGGSSPDYLRSVQQTADGGYIVGGISNSNASGDKSENNLGWADLWIIKLDRSGNVQWENSIGADHYEQLQSVQPTPDGGYLVGASSNSHIAGDKTIDCKGKNSDYWLLQLDASGSIQWQKVVGGDRYDQLNSLQQTADGGFMLGGYSMSGLSGDKTVDTLPESYWMVKLDQARNIRSQFVIAGPPGNLIDGAEPTADSGYILGGCIAPIIKDAKGEVFWNGDLWVVKVDAGGHIQWQQTLGTTQNECFQSLQPTADGGYLLLACTGPEHSGATIAESRGGSDFWLVKLAPENVPAAETSIPTGNVEIYPNPTADAVFVRMDDHTSLRLYNALGQLVSTQTITNESKVDLSHLPDGFYFLIETETGVVHKILKAR